MKLPIFFHNFRTIQPPDTSTTCCESQRVIESKCWISLSALSNELIVFCVENKPTRSRGWLKIPISVVCWTHQPLPSTCWQAYTPETCKNWPQGFAIFWCAFCTDYTFSMHKESWKLNFGRSCRIWLFFYIGYVVLASIIKDWFRQVRERSYYHLSNVMDSVINRHITY